MVSTSSPRGGGSWRVLSSAFQYHTKRGKGNPRLLPAKADPTQHSQNHTTRGGRSGHPFPESRGKGDPLALDHIIYAHMYMGKFLFWFMHIYVHACGCIGVNMCVCVSVNMSVYMNLSVYIYLFK